MISARSVVVFSVLAAGAFGSWYLTRPESVAESDSAALGSAQRGYYLKSARILGTGADGNLLYEIEADRAEQTEGDMIEFSNVRISYSPQSDVPWIVTADAATIQRDQERVLLSGHVTAIGKEADADTEIRTQYLELLPGEYIAETDQRVQIRIGARSLTATGMLASLKDNRLELRSNVSGKFLP